ncbi:LOW QUALITY PROTEIN: protein SCAR2-like [Juglans microcarpa x Juglans regia]|uniref:LOW QUALITY PROTEIN: protein SCAR2-like n=1 Tax=Juglans microcarpa x Juglans regia TaxID=2249226 RepID=UPI001B7F675F|nr:LOW QUALITY PROTEIN: protein SCAR2-like [Juglans microcarpa x Juglans regia]
MPLLKYQIRDKYSLADPELYKAANRDDPEALLEGVAMAGLVGVLRQLGDLAEFAAEIFHDLHEEVMTTAARGHDLMVRVQQLEAEVPSIEKAFLSQTSDSFFFSNAGVDWHPNLRTEQNLITQGDLPRFVMDSYEECRGPPQLFLLDKFDVAGAGACLMRYTDPSFFKVESASSGAATAEVPREKRIRKMKKKGSCWRNGETPEVLPPSHAKLHQLFLKECVENGYSNPARLVKLKRRQLNGSIFDSSAGKSYLDKVLESPTPKQVHEISVTSPMKLKGDSYSESGLEVLEITAVNPAKKSSQGKESSCSSPNAQEVVLKPCIEKFNQDVIGGKTVKVPEPADDDTDNISSSTLHRVAAEEELAIDGEVKTEGCVDGYHSEDLTSDMDNYMDALTTMESEIETENEYTSKMGIDQSQKWKQKMSIHLRNSCGGEVNLGFQARSSDSHSFGNSSASDNGNGLFKCNRSSFSDSDTLSSLTENAAFGGDGSAKVSPSTEICAAEAVDMPSCQVMDESQGAKLDELAVLYDTGIEQDKVLKLGEASCSSCLTDSKPTLLPSGHGVHSSLVTLVGPEVEGATSDEIKLGSKLSEIDENGTNLAEDRVVSYDVPSQILNDIHLIGSAESHSPSEDPNVSDALLHLSDVSEVTPENKGSENSRNEVLQTKSAGEDYSENLVDAKIGSTDLSISPTEKQQLCSVLPEVKASSNVIHATCSDIVGTDEIFSKANNALMANGINLEYLTPVVETQKTCNIEEQKFSVLTYIAPELELASAELGVPCSDEKSDCDEIPTATDKIGTSTCNVDAVGGDAAPLEPPYSCQNHTSHEDYINMEAVVIEPIIPDVVLSAAVTSANDVSSDFIDPSLDRACFSSRNHINLQDASSEFAEPHPKEMEFNDAVSLEYLKETKAQNIVNRLEVARADTPCKSVSSNHSDFKTVAGDDDESSTANNTQYGLSANDASTAPRCVPSNQHLESKTPNQSHLSENGEAEVCSPIGCPQSQGPLKSVMQFEAYVESLQEDEATYNFSRLESEQIRSLNHTDQERCEQIQSSNHLRERCFDSPESDLLSAGWELDGSKQATGPLESALPSFGMLPQAAHVNLEELPPLPPLPPMQWRMGKAPNASLASPRDLVESSQHAFPPLHLFGDEKAQFSFPASQTGILQLQNPFLPITAIEDEKSQQVSERLMTNLSQLIPFSLQLQTMVSDSNSQSSCHSFEGTKTINPFLVSPPTERPESGFPALDGEKAHSSSVPTMVSDSNSQSSCHSFEGIKTLNPFLVSPWIPSERPEFGFPALDGEKAHSSSVPFTPIPTIEYTTSRHDLEVSQEKLIEPFYQPEPETGSVDQKLQPTPHYNSEGESRNSCNTSMPSPTVEGEQPQRDLLSLDGETPQIPDVDVGKPNGNPATKLSRPPKPLIDAVAAHDKSRLRKVAERVRPEIGQKVDERDSLLEQIRRKSFNLKPAAVTRPSIHGPQTNLKVAAILEKAKTVRQAFAGSDEDNDSDSWSDA